MKSEYEYRVLNRKGLSELGQGVGNDKKTFLENGLDCLGQNNWELVSVPYPLDPINNRLAGLCVSEGESNCFGAGVLGDTDLVFDPAQVSLPFSESGTNIFNDTSYSDGLLVITGDTGAAATLCIGEVATCGAFTISTNAAPEPATGGMVMLGMTGLAWSARRRKV